MARRANSSQKEILGPPRRTVFSFPGVTFDHLIPGLEAGVCHVSYGVLFVVGLLGGDDGSEGGEGEVDKGERHQVGLELIQVKVQRTVKS